MLITHYPDNSSYVTVERVQDGIITWRLNSYEALHHLEQFVEAYNFRYKGRPLVTIPNLIDAQADRRFDENQSSGLKIVCKRLNSMNADFKIFHPHNSEVVEALLDNVTIVDNSLLVSKVLGEFSAEARKTVKDYKKTSNMILMSSDAGGFKPLMKLCDSIGWEGDTFSASKARSWDVETGTKFSQKIDREDFKGQDIMIIDDLCVYGGTFKGLAKMLKARNCGKLYLVVSHLTVQNHKGGDTVFNYFDKVFTTNSKFDDYWIEGHQGQPVPPDNLTVVPLF